jgi:hypothetical protein
MFYGMPNAVLFFLIVLVVGGSVALGVTVGRVLRTRETEQRESVGVVQGALLGLVGLLLAFGLSMAVGRYDARRAVVVQEANSIGTTYLRAQLLPEPTRTESMAVLRDYADLAIELADQVPDGEAFDGTALAMEALQQDLWRLAGEAVTIDPTGTAPRLYVETLNDTIDRHTDRVASLRNRVPGTVMMIEVIGSAVALGVLALYLSLLGRGLTTSLLAAVFVVLILFVSFDLDRPQRGFITVPFRVLEEARAVMDLPPAVDPAP